MKDSSKRIVYFDFLNIAACFCVICMHTNGIAHTYSDTLAWKQAMIVETLAYWAVPVFFMLSGATLMNYREKYTTADYFKKRTTRILIPYLIWSVISSVFNHFLPFEAGWRTFLGKLVCGGADNVYWFFIPLFSIYLAIPAISLLKDNRRILWYMTCTAFVLVSVAPVLFRLAGINWNGSLNMPMLGGFLIYTVLGYLLSTEDIPLRRRILIYLLGLFSVLLRYFGTWFLSAKDGTINKTFFGYIEFYAVFLSVSVFLIFKYAKLERLSFKYPRFSSIISKISGCSFGIYLVHMVIYRKILSQIFVPNSWQFRIIGPFLLYIICLIIVMLLKKIPILRKIVP